MIFKKKNIGLLIIPQLLFVQYISNHQDIIEEYYSLGVYQLTSKILRSTLSIFPFSIGDILYIITLIYFIRLIVKEISMKKINLKKSIRIIIFYCSIFHFLFYFLWGLNYHRTSLHEKLTIDSTYTVKDLEEIVKFGFSIKYFNNHSDLCLAGEDKSFIKNFMTKSGQTIFKPALAKDIFVKEDFIK